MLKNLLELGCGLDPKLHTVIVLVGDLYRNFLLNVWLYVVLIIRMGLIIVL